MYKFIKKNQKKVLAFFMVGLMIAFMLPSAMTSMQRTGNPARGHIGKQELTDSEVVAARREWELLSTAVRLRGRFGQTESLADRLGASPFDMFTNNGGYVRSQIEGNANAEAFALLIHEAHAMGVSVSADDIQSAIANATVINDGGPDFEERLTQAVSDMLLVQAAFNRASDVVKVTDPERVHQLAKMQEISLDLVEFNGKNYLTKVTPPTEKEIVDQYNKYAPVEPAAEAGRFGYKLPNRVKVQYIELPASQLEKVATQGIRDQDMRLYWLQHAARYAPSELSLTAPATAPATAPTTRPFEAVREQVYRDMKQEKVDELTKSILLDLNATLNADYAAWKKAVGGPEHPTSMPAELEAKAPETAMGPRYDTYDYLRKLALETQQKFSVLPVVGDVEDFLSMKDLTPPVEPPATQPTTGPATKSTTRPGTQSATGPATLPAQPLAKPDALKIPRDLATASAVDYDRVLFPKYAASFVAPLADEREARSYRIPVLSLNEPSAVLKDSSGNNWIFRVTAIDPAHSQPLADVRAQVDSDARRVKAQQMAKADADALAAGSKKLGLRAAATTRPSLKVQTTGLFKRNDTADALVKALAPYALPNETGRQAFVIGAFDLLSTADSADPAHPVGVIDVTPADRAVAAQITQVKPIWSTESAGETEIEQHVELQAVRMQVFRNQWFNFNAIKARLHYQPSDTGKKNPEPSPEDQQPVSDNPF